MECVQDSATAPLAGCLYTTCLPACLPTDKNIIHNYCGVQVLLLLWLLLLILLLLHLMPHLLLGFVAVLQPLHARREVIPHPSNCRRSSPKYSKASLRPNDRSQWGMSIVNHNNYSKYFTWQINIITRSISYVDGTRPESPQFDSERYPNVFMYLILTRALSGSGM